MSRRPPYLVAVMGPTASGKSALAESLASELDALLLNADAFQVYRGLDIGTSKPAGRAAYRLLDLVDPTDEYSVGQWVSDAIAELEPAWERGQDVVVVGGTGLAIRALFEGYSAMVPPDPALRAEILEWEQKAGLPALASHLSQVAPEIAARTDLRNPMRVRRALEKLRTLAQVRPVRVPPFLQVKTGLNPDVHALNASIGVRVRAMMEAGWGDEVRTLMGTGITMQAPGLRAIGYRALWEAIEIRGKTEDVIESIIKDTQRYAKRQRTWLRSEPRLEVIEELDPCVRVARVMEWIREYARR